MPAVSDKQQRFMGAELARKRAGKKTQTGMTAQQLEDFAKKKAPAAGRVRAKKPPMPKKPPIPGGY